MTSLRASMATFKSCILFLSLLLIFRLSSCCSSGLNSFWALEDLGPAWRLSIGAGFMQELKQNPGGQWGKSWMEPGPQRAGDCSGALIVAFDKTFIVRPEVRAGLSQKTKTQRLQKKNPPTNKILSSSCSSSFIFCLPAAVHHDDTELGAERFLKQQLTFLISAAA